MVKHIFDQDTSFGIIVNTSGDEWIVAKGVTVDSNFTPTITDADFGIMDQDSTSILVRGKIKNASEGLLVDSEAKDLGITIAATGRAYGDINSWGADFAFTNAGIMRGDFSIGRSFELDNSGKMVGNIRFGDDASGTIVNRAGAIMSHDGSSAMIDTWIGHTGSLKIFNAGTMRDLGTGIVVDASPNGGNDKFTNRGLVEGDIRLSHGKDQLVNRGTVEGSISMGDGNDIIDLRRGHVDGWITGSLGDDTYYVSDGAVHLAERLVAGVDTVWSSASFKLASGFEKLRALGNADVKLSGNGVDNLIVGNEGDNILRGLAGDDRLIGGQGNDRLVGGTGADTFIFNGPSGIDHIAGFDVAGSDADLIVLNLAEGFSDFGDVQAHMWKNAQGDTVIGMGKNHRLIIEGVAPGQLSDDNFSIHDTIVL